MTKDMERRRLMVVAVCVPDDIPLARYTVQAAHAWTDAAVILDLSDTIGLEEELGAFVDDLVRTTAGNDQSLALICSDPEPAGLAESGSAGGIPHHATLPDALASHAMVGGLPSRVELTLPSRIHDLPDLRSFLAEVHVSLYGKEPGMELSILADELWQNAVQNSPSNKSYYEVVLACSEGTMTLEVSNTGDDSIVPERIMQARLKTFDDSGNYMGERGRGLFLIARLADDLDIKSGPGDRITVIATKKIEAAQP